MSALPDDGFHEMAIGSSEAADGDPFGIEQRRNCALQVLNAGAISSRHFDEYLWRIARGIWTICDRAVLRQAGVETLQERGFSAPSRDVGVETSRSLCWDEDAFLVSQLNGAANA